MEIRNIEKSTVFFMETDKKGCCLYTRYAKDNWTISWRIGEGDEPAYGCEDLEKAFQENVKKFI